MVTKQENDLIRNAIVSVYINLARIHKITKKDIGIIHNMLKSIYGHEINRTSINRFVNNLLSIREAANILTRYLRFSDKIKFLLNLLSISYYRDTGFRVLGSLEIIKIVDLLYIDVNIYDEILDLLEGKTTKVQIPVDKFLPEKENKIFSNIMFWGDYKNSDIFLKDKQNTNVVFLVFEKLLMVGHLNCSNIKIDNKSLAENKFYIIKKEQKVKIQSKVSEISISSNEIKQIYNSVLLEKQRTIHYETRDLSFIIFQQGGKILLSLDKGKLSVSGNQIHKKCNIAINDVIEIANTTTGLDILSNKMKFLINKDEVKEYYLEVFEKFFHIHYKRSAKSLAKIEISNNNDIYIVPINKRVKIYINNRILKGRKKLNVNKDIITINDKNFKINKYLDIIKIEYSINSFSVQNLCHQFKDGNAALDEISFQLKKGEMMAIIGSSGSGKTTLLKTLSQDIIPDKGNIKIDGYDLHSNYGFFNKYIGYVPAYDLLFNNLTVYENLYFCARLRLNYVKDKAEIDRRIDNILTQVRLSDRRDTKVGDIMHEKLSGGQRKRLNIALELLSDPLIIFLDEPTSGLSSKDSENLINILLSLKEQGKIIITSIHQPNSDLFQKFNKILFLDKYGTQVYFGDVEKIFDYFDEELLKISINKRNLIEKKALKMPEYLFDILEYRKEDFSFDLNISKNDISDETHRKFPPEYWKEKYNKDALYHAISENKNEAKPLENNQENKKLIKSSLNLEENFLQAFYIFYRNLKNKLTNKINLVITFIAAPLLSFIVAFILRYNAEEEVYKFYNNDNIVLFIFISVIIFIFFGLANSLDEILAEKRIIIREKKMNIKSIYFLLAKNITLLIFSIIQSLLFIFIASLILKIKGMLLLYAIFLILSGMIGFSIGLLASAFIHDRKAIINILPIVIIPQILFAGAVIRFDKMNSSLKINQKASVPEFCQIIPSKWLFEGLVVAQEQMNPYDKRLNAINDLRKRKKSRLPQKKINKRMNELLANYDAKKYRNNYITQIVDNRDGNYLLHKKNFFLASKKNVFGYEINTVYINICVILFIFSLLNALTYIKLKYFYK